MAGVGNDTIAALATVPGMGALAVIRMSGPAAIDIADKVFRGRRRPARVVSRSVLVGEITAADGQAIDQVLVTVMKSPHTLTGEDVVEVGCHGGMMAPRLVLRRLIEEGARPAAAGEFTKRAFLNGKMDLAQAEAVGEIVRASSEKALRIAVRQLRGELSERLAGVERDLLSRLAHVEATIDFVEDDIEQLDGDDLAKALNSIHSNLDDLLRAHREGSHLKDGLDVVIVGKPNVGKSSLFNKLLGADRVIVSDEPGTTRDVVDGLMSVDGVVLKLRDTAGVREAAGGVEQAALEHTARAIEDADIALVVFDASCPLSDEDLQVFQQVSAKPHLVVGNKIDLPLRADLCEFERAAMVSALNGSGIPTVTDRLREMAQGQIGDLDCTIVVGERHAECLRSAAGGVARAAAALHEGLPPEFIASDMRLALDSLGEITGTNVGPSILDEIFARFCIGK